MCCFPLSFFLLLQAADCTNKAGKAIPFVAKKTFFAPQAFLSFQSPTTYFSIMNTSDKNERELPRPRAKLRPCFGIRWKVLHQVLHQLNLSQR
jgi:hypothetical protein